MYKNGYQQIKTDGDRELLITVIILVVIGLMAVVSASLPLCVTRHLPPFHYVLQHLFWIVLGSLGLWFFSRFDYNKLRKFTFPFAFGVIILLLIKTKLMNLLRNIILKEYNKTFKGD